MENTSVSLQLFLTILLSGFIHLQTIKPGFSITTTTCSEIERKALLNFKAGLSDPSDRLSSWSGEDCCSWFGVQCDKDNGFVTKLSLRNEHEADPDNLLDSSGYALGGKISPSLLALKHLDYLDLSMNMFEGNPIPNFIGSIQTLRYLNLSGASFGGTIPTSFGNLTSLVYLDLNNCFEIPVGNDLNWLSTGLSSLKYLHLGNLDLSKAADNWVESVNKLVSLSELRLPVCGLTSLPVSLPLVRFKSLSVVDLSSNGFNSSIPSWITELHGLTYLDLSSNNLRGEFPDGFADLGFLQYLDLHQNSFLEGKITEKNIAKLCGLRVVDLSFNTFHGGITEFIDGVSKCNNQSLEMLHFGYNQLDGTLPDSLGNLKNIKRLYLVGNSFSGSIPDSIGNLSFLQELDISENKMDGRIPESIGKLSSLVSLDLKKNQWGGIVTEGHFGNLTSLKELYISQNVRRNISLVFDLSSEWLPPFKLRFLNIQGCKIGPEFPRWLRNQNQLQAVSVWNAGIVGPIPDWFWELNLVFDELDFSYNNMTGSIPEDIKFTENAILFLNFNQFTGPLPTLSSNLSSYHLDHNMFSGPIPRNFGESRPLLADVDISVNELNGTIPLSIGNLTSLLTLVLSYNRLTGKIPEVWTTTPDAYVIDLSYNDLSGEIPRSLGSLSGLKFLFLGSNNLSGEIPSSLGSCTLLETVDLGDNRLSGKLPGWFGSKLPSLLILSLRSNMFKDQIPTELCGLSSLHILDIAENNIFGSIPRCIGNLSGMSLDVSKPRYEGQVTVVSKGRDLLYESTLFLVNTVDFSDNNLSGTIPKEFANLTRLGTLNLSMNHLTGNIPPQLGSFRRLETLDLSRNRLSGEIPPTMTSITSLNHFNVSFNNLSGKIPTANQFSTLIDPSIYKGNGGLCGVPLTTKCVGDEVAPLSPDTQEEDDDDDDNDGVLEKLWLYIAIVPGFLTGFLVFWGTLTVKTSWRIAYFRYIDEKRDKLIFAITGRRVR